VNAEFTLTNWKTSKSAFTPGTHRLDFGLSSTGSFLAANPREIAEAEWDYWLGQLEAQFSAITASKAHPVLVETSSRSADRRDGQDSLRDAQNELIAETTDLVVTKIIAPIAQRAVRAAIAVAQHASRIR